VIHSLFHLSVGSRQDLQPTRDSSHLRARWPTLCIQPSTMSNLDSDEEALDLFTEPADYVSDLVVDLRLNLTLSSLVSTISKSYNPNTYPYIRPNPQSPSRRPQPTLGSPSMECRPSNLHLSRIQPHSHHKQDRSRTRSRSGTAKLSMCRNRCKDGCCHRLP